MASNLKSFSFAIILHVFVVLFLLAFNKTHSNFNTLEKNIKLIRLVSFGSGNGNEKTLSQAYNSNKNSQVKTISTTSKIIESTPMMNGNKNTAIAAGTGSGIGGGVGTGSDSSGGIDSSQATALEIEVNKLRLYIQKYLDSKLDSQNINFNIQLTLNKSSGISNIEVLTEQLSSKQIYLIKKIISSYQHQNLLNHLPNNQMNILIPIKII